VPRQTIEAGVWFTMLRSMILVSELNKNKNLTTEVIFRCADRFSKNDEPQKIKTHYWIVEILHCGQPMCSVINLKILTTLFSIIAHANAIYQKVLSIRHALQTTQWCVWTQTLCFRFADVVNRIVKKRNRFRCQSAHVSGGHFVETAVTNVCKIKPVLSSRKYRKQNLPCS